MYVVWTAVRETSGLFQHQIAPTLDALFTGIQTVALVQSSKTESVRGEYRILSANKISELPYPATT